MSTPSEQMQINADADARLTAAFANHAAGRAVAAAAAPGFILRLALRVRPPASRVRGRTVPAPA
jgi:hypothetical protein